MWDAQDLVIQNPLYHNQAPCHNQRLNRIREHVGLVRPCNVRRSHQYHGQSSLPRGLDKLMYRPVFQYEAKDEHEDSHGVVYDLGSYLLFPGLCPYPSKHDHGEAIYGPQWEDTPYRMVGCELPCFVMREGEDFA